jgi:hypothetical protein
MVSMTNASDAELVNVLSVRQRAEIPCPEVATVQKANVAGW